MTVRVSHINTFVIALVTGLTMGYQACSPVAMSSHAKAGATDGKGWAAANGGTITDNPKPTLQVEVSNFPADAAALNLKICINEIRFRQDDDEIRAEFTPKFVQLDPKGTVLGEALNIPPGKYDRIELRLSPNCGGLSASATNANGSFDLNSELRIRFAGQVTVGNSSTLLLGMNSMLSAAAAATNTAGLYLALTESEGHCGGGN